MKTFQQFQEQLSLSQAFQKIGKGRGVADAGEGISRSLESERSRVTSDRARPKGSTSGVRVTTPLNQATYQGRVEAGKNTPERQKKRVADNPNFQGPMQYAGQGTKDRMPGTTPESNPRLKPIPKPTPTAQQSGMYGRY